MASLLQLVDGVIVHKFDVVQDNFSIGRSALNDIAIDDTAVSGVHAKINCYPNEHFPEYKEYFITDENSTNGTEVNGSSISKQQKLSNNDIIKIAWNEFKFVDEKQENLEKTLHMLDK